MLRRNVYNLWFDFRDFLRCNRMKLLCAALVVSVGIVLGIRSGFAVYDAGAYLSAHPSNVYLLIVRQKSAFGCFFGELLTNLLLLWIVVFCSANFLLAYLGFVILLFRAYLFAMYLCLYIFVLKLSVLPLVFFCLLPCFLVTSFLLAVVCILSLNRAQETRRYGWGCSPWRRYFICMLVPSIMFGILAVLCSILCYFLTLGIIL